MTIGLYGRVLHEAHTDFAQQLINLLYQKEIDFAVHQLYYPIVKEKIVFKNEPKLFQYSNEIAQHIDYLLTLGGDGTLLDSVNIVRNTNVKVMGINMGRLGFLATVNKTEIENALTALQQKTYIVDERTLLQVALEKPLFGDLIYGLNEFTIYKKDSSSMITVHAFINGEFLNSYWADGVIVATPTGSTGYSLSCGGPVIQPASKTLVVTPIAPHNLNVRPIVVDENVEISFDAEGRNDQFIATLDSRHTIIDVDDIPKVKKADFKLQLIRLPESSFLHSLRSKLMWGVDKRN